MNTSEKRIYDDVIRRLRSYSGNDMWECILEEQDGEYNIALPITMDILELIINYEKGKKEIDERVIEFYCGCYEVLYDLDDSINWNNYLDE
ncbi:hypothetical protein [Clostridium disporicum]|uniref:Uncharacterized protein n=1 Tax=Clostridium disporicum TaxID=84024 RepID=A0A174JKC4_9CLOT|nr:hypothetical protein [Clostridium disporicum]CUO98307.1 Uncharacterised protein [Clostridium disporicum]